MKTVVLGAGALGSIIAAHLAHAGEPHGAAAFARLVREMARLADAEGVASARRRRWHDAASDQNYQ